jgi:hypothetical protein
MGRVRLDLTSDEALVLFEFLSRFNDSDKLSLEDPAEQRALEHLHCLLEKQLVEPIDPNYQELLRQARDRLRDPVE